MAGNPGSRAQLLECRERCKVLEAELFKLKADGRTLSDRQFTPREFHLGTKQALMRDLLALSDEAHTIDEVAASWNVEASDVLGWAENDVDFGVALRRARTRARAAAARMVRTALNSGRSLPGSVIDKLMALYPAGDQAAADDATALISVDQRCVDDASTSASAHVIESPSVSQVQAPHRPALERFARGGGGVAKLADSGGGGQK